jgi:hypothetical protein
MRGRFRVRGHQCTTTTLVPLDPPWVGVSLNASARLQELTTSFLRSSTPAQRVKTEGQRRTHLSAGMAKWSDVLVASTWHEKKTCLEIVWIFFLFLGIMLQSLRRTARHCQTNILLLIEMLYIPPLV